MKVYIRWDKTHPNGHMMIFNDPNLVIVGKSSVNSDMYIDVEERNKSSNEIKIGNAKAIK